MITEHLTDMEVQLYIGEPEMVSSLLAAHVKTCTHCQARAANYTTLFGSLQQTVQPEFDFDLAELVLADLPAKKTPYTWLPAIAGGLGAVLIIPASVIFGGRLAPLFSSLPASMLWLMLLPAAVLLVMQAVVISSDHHRKMSVLINS
jgi:hypothetical protein